MFRFPLTEVTNSSNFICYCDPLSFGSCCKRKRVHELVVRVHELKSLEKGRAKTNMVDKNIYGVGFESHQSISVITVVAVKGATHIAVTETTHISH